MLTHSHEAAHVNVCGGRWCAQRLHEMPLPENRKKQINFAYTLYLY